MVDGYGYASGIVDVYGGSLGMVQNALAELGVHEYAGSLSNPEVLKYWDSLPNGSDVSNGSDATPWCSAFVNWVTEKSGFVGTDSAAASSWFNWGSQTNDPKPGDVAVKMDGSHVGIVSSVENGVVTIVSGNYSDSVTQSDASSGYTFRTHTN